MKGQYSERPVDACRNCIIVRSSKATTWLFAAVATGRRSIERATEQTQLHLGENVVVRSDKLATKRLDGNTRSTGMRSIRARSESVSRSQ